MILHEVSPFVVKHLERDTPVATLLGLFLQGKSHIDAFGDLQVNLVRVNVRTILENTPGKVKVAHKQGLVIELPPLRQFLFFLWPKDPIYLNLDYLLHMVKFEIEV